MQVCGFWMGYQEGACVEGILGEAGTEWLDSREPRKIGQRRDYGSHVGSKGRADYFSSFIDHMNMLF